MRSLAILVLVVLGAACDAKRSIGDGGPIDGAQPTREGSAPEARPIVPDLPDLPIKGRIVLREIRDPRVNMAFEPIATAEFTDTGFYDTQFLASASQGECAIGNNLPPPPAVPHWIDAGPVMVQGGDLGFALSFQPSTTYKNDLPSATYSIFSDGQSLVLSGPGSSSVPGALQATLHAPAALQVSTPDLFKMKTKVSKAASWSVKWKAEGGTGVSVMLSCPTSMGALRCDSPDDGEIVIAAALLVQLAAQCTEPEFRIERMIRSIVAHAKAAIVASASDEMRGGLQLE